MNALQQATQSSPSCAKAFLLLGLQEFHFEDIDRSIQHYQRALALDPRSYSGHYDLALAYLKQRNLQEARAQLQRAVELDPRQADAAYDLGMVLLEVGEPRPAVIQLRRAQEIDPKRPDVAFNLVRAYLESSQIADAKANARVSAKRFGSDVQWTAAIGQLFVQNAQPKDAVPYLLEASRLRPDDAEVRRQLATAYLKSGQPDQVWATLVRPQTSEDYYLRGSAFYLAHRFPEADQESNQALQMTPDNPQILVLRTRLLQRAGEQEEALALASKAIALAPKWDEPYYLAGVSYYFIRRYEEAEASLAHAIALNPNSARALFLQSIALANMGKVQAAEHSLRQAIALQPKNSRLYCHLGILLARDNQQVEAENALRKAIQLRGEYGLAHYELGKLLISGKRLSPATQELERAVKTDPELTSAFYQLSRAYAKLGNDEKSQWALAEFERLSQQEAQDPRPVDQALDDGARTAIEVR